jgi:hypothetical protein
MDGGPANGMVDFKGVYYDTQCMIQHTDPYLVGEPLRVYLLAYGGQQAPSQVLRQILAYNVYLPTSSILIAPIAMLPWGFAHILWRLLTAIALFLTASLIWSFGANYSLVLTSGIACFFLLNCEAIFATGNTAGVAVALCVIGVWCIMQERFIWPGMFCMAVGLLIKPHDAGLVWLFFLLAGGVYRKRALQTLVLTVVLGLPSIVWISEIAPNWMQELHTNLRLVSQPGGSSDPGPASALNGKGPSMIINLQSDFSIFRNDPHFYNLASYLVCGTLLLIWAIITVRSRPTSSRAWLGLAAVIPLAILVVYHRPYDAKLLLLTLPACAILWAGGGVIAWIALLVTLAGVVMTADLPLAFLMMLTEKLHFSEGVAGRMMTTVLTRPVPLILLAMSFFYLWAYLQRDAERG